MDTSTTDQARCRTDDWNGIVHTPQPARAPGFLLLVAATAPLLGCMVSTVAWRVENRASVDIRYVVDGPNRSEQVGVLKPGETFETKESCAVVVVDEPSGSTVSVVNPGTQVRSVVIVPKDSELGRTKSKR